MKQLILSLAIFSTFAACTSLATQSKMDTQGELAIVIFSLKDKVEDPLYNFIRPQIEVASTEQAQVWGDTILEGDYVSDGHTQVDQVVALYKDNVLQNYKFTYSEKAWMISDCDYNIALPESLKSCVSGRIIESSYSSPDFKKIDRDVTEYAQFTED